MRGNLIPCQGEETYYTMDAEVGNKAETYSNARRGKKLARTEVNMEIAKNKEKVQEYRERAKKLVAQMTLEERWVRP